MMEVAMTNTKSVASITSLLGVLLVGMTLGAMPASAETQPPCEQACSSRWTPTCQPDRIPAHHATATIPGVTPLTTADEMRPWQSRDAATGG
jgi:hypothetical protein